MNRRELDTLIFPCQSLHINGTQTRPLLSIFFIPVFGRAGRQAGGETLRCALCAAFALISIAGVFAACQAPEPPWTTRPYYDVYDEAINLYYKPPRRPEAALTLMERACRLNSDGQDILCYNLGVLRELENRPTAEVLAAYVRAQKIRPHPLYQAAIQRQRPDPEKYTSPYLQSAARMVADCNQGHPDRALSELRRIVPRSGTAANAASNSTVPRETFAQPFFVECMGGLPEYQTLLEKLQPAGGDLADRILRARARLDPFYSLWDVEINLRELDDGAQTKHPATAEWQDFVVNARQGQVGPAALHLRSFFDVLDDIARDTRKNSNAATAAATDRRVLAFKRAAAVLIQGDPYFHRIRGQAAILQIIHPILQ